MKVFSIVAFLLYSFSWAAGPSAPSCQSVKANVENVLASAGKANVSTAPDPGRYGDMGATERASFIEQASRMPQAEAYSYSGTPVRIRAELLKSDPKKIDWNSARNNTRSVLSQGFDKFFRATTPTEKISYLKRIEEDAGLLGIQSRSSPTMMAKAKEIYLQALKERMKRESVKDPNAAVEWLKKLAAEKKGSSRVGVDGEIDRWSAGVIEEALEARKATPKDWVTDTASSGAFSSAKLDEAVKAGKEETDKANALGQMVTEEPNAPYRQVASSSNATVAAAPPNPLDAIKRSASETDQSFARRTKEAQDFAAWSGGKALTNEQSTFLSQRLRNLSNYETNYAVVEELRRVGFDEVEIRMMQLNRFEFGVNKSFAMPKATPQMTEQAMSMFRTDKIMKAPENLDPVQAKNVLADNYGLKPAQVDDIRDRVTYQMDETIQHMYKLNQKILEATNKDEILKINEARKAYALRCRKIYQAFAQSQIFLLDAKKREYEKAVTSGNCRY